MALDSFSALKTSVLSWLHRADLNSVIDDFVTLAEKAISNDLAGCPVMLVVESGVSLAQGASSFTLPVNARGLRTIRITSPHVSVVPILDYADLVHKTELNASLTGAPSYGAVIGNTGSTGTLTVQVYPTADQAYTLEVVYEHGLTALSDSNTTNFILVRAPELYLAAILREACLYIMDEARAKIWHDRYTIAIESFKDQHWSGNVLLRTELGMHDSFNIWEG